MELELAKKIVDLIEEFGEEAYLYEDYSGRFMYGNTTAGVVCKGIGIILRLVIENASEFVDEDGYPMYELIGEFATDSMGLSTIVY